MASVNSSPLSSKAYSLVISTLLLLLVVWATGSEASGGSERCLLDDDQTNAALESCLQNGEEFVKQLLEQQRASGRRRKSINVICQSFSSFKRCFEPILQSCSHVPAYSHWKIIYDVVNCACNNTPSCHYSLNCFMEQMKGKLGRQCDARYRFNSKQETQDRCHFLYDNVRCKEALVESACSPEAGVFAFHVAKIASNVHIRKYGCVITREKEYRGFRYTQECPPNMTTVMDNCERNHIHDRLAFRHDFDLIPDASRRLVRDSCKEFHDYQTCVKTLNDQCSHGTRRIYDFDGGLRTYIMKMGFICGDGKKGFNTHLRCFRDLLENNTLTKCNHIWHDVEPSLEDSKAHQFYCQPTSPVTIKLKQSLQRLRECYQDVFATHCHEGGDVVGELMSRVFQDPVYLRYRFRPDCDLHAVEPYATGAPPAATTRQPPKPPAQTRPQDGGSRNKPSSNNGGKSPSVGGSTGGSSAPRISFIPLGSTLGIGLLLTLTAGRGLS